MKCIKKMNDFVLGILMILLSAFLVFGKITETEVKTGQGGFLVRSDVWLRMMGVFLVIVAVILIIRSFGKKEGEEAEGFHFYLDSTVVAVIVSLIVYALALPKVGFMITTFLMCLYLVILFSVKEQSLTFRTVPKALWGKLLDKGRSVCGSDAGGVLVYIWQAPVRPVPHVLPVWLRLNAVCAPLK